jgi:hypothetical protein
MRSNRSSQAGFSGRTYFVSPDETGERADDRARWALRGAVSGIGLCALWAPMGLVIPQLPDLGSSAEIESFYRGHADLLKVVILLVAAGYFFLLGFLGALFDRLRRIEGPLPWIAFASALMFMTSLNIALGLAATAGLLSSGEGAASTGALHRAAFLLAAPAAPAGAAFFVATSALSFRTGVFPRWLAWFGVFAAVSNVGALGGIVSFTGPLNSGNGAVGGIAAPVLAWLLWILLTSLCLIKQADGETPRAPPRRSRRLARRARARTSARQSQRGPRACDSPDEPHRSRS